MKTNIVVNFQIEGFHCWPKAFPIYSYLKDRHQHYFNITCKKNVDGIVDREIEIIDYRRRMQRFLLDNFGNKPPLLKINMSEPTHCEFGSLSCESIAQFLLKSFDLDYCSVFEGTEVGAEVIKENLFTNRSVKSYKGKVTFVVGEICSGKSTIANEIRDKILSEVNVNLFQIPVIEIGQVVRDITKTNNRIQSADLDTQIIKTIIDSIEGASQIVIVGPRTMTVLISLREYYKSIGYDTEYVLIKNPDLEVLAKRYTERKNQKDTDLSFKEAHRRDIELGLDCVIEYLMKRKSKVVFK